MKSTIATLLLMPLLLACTANVEPVEDDNDAITLENDSDAFLTQHNIVDVGNTVFSANFDGAADGTDDGTATVASSIITATDQTGAEGLKVLYTGGADTSAIQIDFSIGVGASMFFELDLILDLTAGSIQGQIAVLEGRNTLAQDRIDSIDRRLVIQRDTLISRFIAAELALASMKNLLNSITQTFAALDTAQRR